MKEAGGSYQPSIREQKIADFNESIPLIEKIILRVGGFHQGLTVTKFILGDKEIQVKEKHIEDSDFQTIGHIRYEGTKEDFLKEFQTLHIGEWKRRYNDPDILDGTQWELEIFFTTGKVLRSGGSNKYPYNFGDFCRLFKSEEKIDEGTCK